MKRKLTRSFNFIIAIALAAAIAAPALPQSLMAADTPSPVAVGRINPNTIKLNKRTPIPHKPFEVLDPRTRKPMSRDAKLPALPNGKVLTAGQYYDELNKLERGLNALGYSLKDSSTQPTELQESVIPQAMLDAQVQKLTAAQIPNTRSQRFNLQAAEQKQKTIMATAQAIDVNKLKLLFPTKTVEKHWSWSNSWGNPSVFSANISAKLDVVGQRKTFATGVKLDAEAKAGGSVFGHGFELVRVTGNLTGIDYVSAPDTVSASLGVYVLGTKVYNLAKTQNASYSKSDSFSKTIDKSVKINFALGPIPMSAKVGVQGTGGIGYSVSIGPLAASAGVGPFVKTNAYAQVGVDIVVAGAGVGGSLTFLNYEPTLEGSIAFGISAANKAYFKTTIEVCHELKLLGGKLYVYAYVYVPCWDWPPWCKKQWNWTIWNWNGIQSNACLFNYSNTTYL